MNTRRTALAVSVLGLVGLTTLSGCATSNDNSVAGIRSHLTPELSNISRTKTEVNNARAITTNQHLRALGNDVGHLLLFTDRPTRLTSHPVAY